MNLTRGAMEKKQLSCSTIIILIDAQFFIVIKMHKFHFVF